MRLKILLSCFILLLISSLSFALDPDAIIGKWLTSDKDAIIEFYKCGKKYCGRIVWAKEPNKKDIHNPDPSLRNRPLLGATILEGFEFNGKNEWVHGRIYDPDNGKKYKCKLKIDKDGILEVRGYMLIPLFGKTVKWTRVDQVRKYSNQNKEVRKND